MIPEYAVQAAAKNLYQSDGFKVWDKEDASTRAHYARKARAALEAAAPHMLSHEMEETRLAHVDAVVNAESLSKYEDAIAKVLEVCEEMDVGAQWKSGDPKTKSVAAKAIRASITESLQ